MEPTLTAALFELELALPDKYLASEAERLIGFAQRFVGIESDLRLLVDRDGLDAWSTRHYGRRMPFLDTLARRYPLLVFHGDVGTGKTVTAEACANELTRRLQTSSMLFKLSTRVRGEGHVGQMSSLINQAFDAISDQAGKHRTAYLIIDEADSLSASRDQQHSHHEDKVAVNTLIQKIDDLRRFGGRIVVFLVTNRYAALDPAIVRRAMRIEHFTRPNDNERRAVLQAELDGLGLNDTTLEQLVQLTGGEPAAGRLGFTFSDLRTRLLPDAVARAYPDQPLSEEHLLTAAATLTPSPGIVENDGS